MHPELPTATPTEHIGDGRRRKSEHRRRRLLAATLGVIEERGVGAVSQRTVAAAAELPPSAVMYHFRSVDELLVATLVMVNDAYIERIESLPSEPGTAIAGLAGLIAETASRLRASLIAEYELVLMAARRPDLHGELDRWGNCLDGLVSRFTDDASRRDAAAAAIDGLFLRALASPETTAQEHVTGVLAHLLHPATPCRA